MSLMTLYFPDEVDEDETFAEIRDIVDEVIPCDEYIDEMLVVSMSQIDGTIQLELASPFDLLRCPPSRLLRRSDCSYFGVFRGCYIC